MTGPTCDEFDPWEVIDCVYGAYNSEFSRVALEVLRDLVSQNRWEERSPNWGLPHEIFQEMLCVLGLCDYGTSPRGCFASRKFKLLLPKLIEKWEKYHQLYWGDDKCD